MPDLKEHVEQQILCGLHECFHDCMGFEVHFEAETNFIELMESEGVLDELDLMDFFWRIEKFFDFHTTKEAWLFLMGDHIPVKDADEWNAKVKPNLTFGLIVEFVAERVEIVSLEPVNIAGIDCRPAGVFLGIQDLIEKDFPQINRFGPSTSIYSRLQGQNLDDFWTKLSWISVRKIPELPFSWRMLSEAGNLAGFIVLVTFWMILGIPFFISLVAAFAIGIFVRQTCQVVKGFANPLPKEIQTFGDLSVWIANAQ